MNANPAPVPSCTDKLDSCRPKRLPNVVMRPAGEGLTDAEVNKIIKAARSNRYGARDALMIELMWKNGLRVSEVCRLTWDDVKGGRLPTLTIRRAKGGKNHVNPLSPEHMRALNALRPEEATATLFVTERGDAFTTGGVAKMIERAGRAAGIKAKVHPHQFRHACATHLAPKMPQVQLAAHLGLVNSANLGHYYDDDPERRRYKW